MNIKKEVIAVISVLLVVSLTFGSVYIHNRGNNKKTITTHKVIKKKETNKKIEETTITESMLKNFTNDSGYTLYYPLTDYQTFYKQVENVNSSQYNSMSYQETYDEIEKLNLSEYTKHDISNTVRFYENSSKYFDTLISVQPGEKNQKYKRNYYFKDGKFVYAYVYDMENDQTDYYRYYFSGHVIYHLTTPYKEYTFSEIEPSKWGCFSYTEANELYNQYK